ncbi:MAG: hypothetical protein ACLFQB_05705 [Chitinispirillaceae bacterium]
MDRNITLIDTTLRDGSQRSHIVFSQEDKLRIVGMLSSCGISVLEAGVPAMGKDEQNSMLDLKQKFPQIHLIGWCRMLKRDIDAALNSGCDSVHISFPTSGLHQAVINVTQRDVLNNLQQLMEYACKRFIHVSVGAQDASRADRVFLKKFVAAAVSAEAKRVRIADTVGILTPLATAAMIEDLIFCIPDADLEFHAHNDLGMATANTVTAIESGARSASVTLCGIGERAGNAPLEEVSTALYIAGNFSTGISTQHLKHICKSTYKIIRQVMPFQKPVVGEGVFSHESGIHCHGLIRDVRTYEPFCPEKVGQNREFFAGSHSGTAGISALLTQNGIKADKINVSNLVGRVREISRQKSDSLSSKEIGNLFGKKHSSEKRPL